MRVKTHSYGGKVDEGSGEQLSDSRATVGGLWLTRVFTLRTLSAGERLGCSSDRIYCLRCLQLLSTLFQTVCRDKNVSRLHTQMCTKLTFL